MNYSIKIDLLKVKNAFVRNITGKESTKRCIIIPIDGNVDLFEGEKGVYLNVTAFELREPKDYQSHLLKVSLPKEAFAAMSDEEKKNQPILGGMKQFIPAPVEHAPVGSATMEPGDGTDDLPF